MAKEKIWMILPRINPTIALSTLQNILHFAPHGLERLIVGGTRLEELPLSYMEHDGVSQDRCEIAFTACRKQFSS